MWHRWDCERRRDRDPGRTAPEDRRCAAEAGLQSKDSGRVTSHPISQKLNNQGSPVQVSPDFVLLPGVLFTFKLEGVCFLCLLPCFSYFFGLRAPGIFHGCIAKIEPSGNEEAIQIQYGPCPERITAGQYRRDNPYSNVHNFAAGAGQADIAIINSP